MAPPSPLAIATSSLNRLVKEEASYHKELKSQQARIDRLVAGEGADDENAEYILRQERKAYEETEKIFPELQKKIDDAKGNLERQLKQSEGVAPPEEVTKAKDAIAAATKTKEQE